MPQSGMSRAAKLRAVARGVWGHAHPRKFFKNCAISCVLMAIFNHFHDKIFSQKFMNKQEFFMPSAAPPLIYLNIDIMEHNI